MIFLLTDFFITRHAEKNDTTQTFLVLTNLRPRVKYELAVKAGNENGTSQLSASLVFTVQDYVETTSTGAMITLSA